MRIIWSLLFCCYICCYISFPCPKTGLWWSWRQWHHPSMVFSHISGFELQSLVELSCITTWTSVSWNATSSTINWVKITTADSSKYCGHIFKLPIAECQDCEHSYCTVSRQLQVFTFCRKCLTVASSAFFCDSFWRLFKDCVYIDLSILVMIGFSKYPVLVFAFSEPGISPYPDFKKPDFATSEYSEKKKGYVACKHL